MLEWCIILKATISDLTFDEKMDKVLTKGILSVNSLGLMVHCCINETFLDNLIKNKLKIAPKGLEYDNRRTRR